MNEVLVQLPPQLDNMKLPDPALALFYSDIQERTIWVDYDIDIELLAVAKYILAWNREDKDLDICDRKPIKLLIHSYGGDLDPTLALINIIENSITPIYTYICGVAMSAGLYLALSGHKRYCLKDSSVMLHQGSAQVGGTADQVKQSTLWYEKQLEKLKNYVLDRTELDPKTYKKKATADWYLTLDELLKYKFVDKSIDNINQIILPDIYDNDEESEAV